MPFLAIERQGAIVTATMNQPETRNALTGNTAVEEFVQLCADLRRDTSVKVLILTGAGPIFSSGGNVKDMKRFFDDALTPDLIREEYRQGIQQIPNALYQLDVPVICAVNGPAIGAGLDLTCMCDIRIASETATFAESFVRVGIVPGDGGAWLLPRAVGMAMASEMAFTGEPISAQEALQLGLINRVADDLDAGVQALLDRFLDKSPAAIRRGLYLMKRIGAMSFEESMAFTESQIGLFALTEDAAEGQAAFREKRKPKWSGR